MKLTCPIKPAHKISFVWKLLSCPPTMSCHNHHHQKHHSFASKYILPKIQLTFVDFWVKNYCLVLRANLLWTVITIYSHWISCILALPWYTNTHKLTQTISKTKKRSEVLSCPPTLSSHNHHHQHHHSFASKYVLPKYSFVTKVYIHSRVYNFCIYSLSLSLSFSLSLSLSLFLSLSLSLSL